ncbi:hypothetical protein HCH03_13905 [Gordonibacter massiliensis]|nr:hypothetical protein [Gordonibacter massiliensis (ex Traore et al. 2017)]
MKSLEEMTITQIEGYAKAHGIDLGGAKTKQEKIEAVKEAEAGVERVSVMGIDVDVDMRVFDDIDLLDMLDDFQNGDALKFKKILNRIFREQSEEVFDKLKDARGLVTVSRASEFFVAVMEAVDAKN